MSAFELAIHAAAGREYVPYLRRHLRRAREMIKSPLAKMSLVLVGDAPMSRLHERHMKLSGPTDVLTFPLETDSRGRATAGEVYVCVPEARRQARRHGTDVAPELLLYAVHGMLHLSGMDDRTEKDFRRMHRKEDKILARLGVGPVFAPRATCSRGKSGREGAGR
jgi:probable rRNA maturation factor